jgi:hypothetical protein
MGTTERPIAVGDTVEFTPADWRKIGDLAGLKKVAAINMYNGTPFYVLDCGNIKIEATGFEVKKHNQ